MTLKELRALVSKTTDKAIPSAKSLIESGEPPFLEKELEHGHITVFKNGFVIYSSFESSTVLKIDEAADYKYYFVDGCSEISEDYLLNEDFSIFVVLIGEDRLVHNQNVNSERHECSYSHEDSEWGAMEDTSQNIEEDYLRRVLLAEVCSILTPRQAQIVRLSYEDGLTMREVGARLEISFQAVESTLAAVRKKVRKNYQFF